jgi:hypothetical protein
MYSSQVRGLSRQIGREHVLALRSHAALDPLDEIVERLLARLGVEPAVTGRAHHALHQQAAGPGGGGAAPVRLLEALRHPRVAGLVQSEERYRQAARPAPRRRGSRSASGRPSPDAAAGHVR